MKGKALLSLIGTYSPLTTKPIRPFVMVNGDYITIYTGTSKAYKANSPHVSYDSSKGVIRVYGNKYRPFIVEKNYVAEIDISSLSFHQNQIVGLYTSYTNPNGLSSINISTTKGFSKTYSLSYKTQITIGLASTISLGIEGMGLSATSNTQTIQSQSFSTTYEYSLTYSNSITKNVTMDLNKVPENCHVGCGVAANILRGKVTTYVEEHWFYGIKQTEYSSNNPFEYLSEIHDTLTAKNKSTGEEFAYE